MKKINGGVCAAKGFRASGVHCGVRKNRTKRDLALIVSDVRGSAAAVYTTNLVKGAPLHVTREHISDGYAQAIVANSGNANTCNANGVQIAEQMCDIAAKTLGIPAADIAVASTGVIGMPLAIEPMESGIPAAAAALGDDCSADAAEAIMTTDTKKKESAYSFECGGTVCHIGGIAKGSGMIHPNMATMLCFITCDAAISPEMLKSALKGGVCDTFNMLSIDGDTSTNDMTIVISNGMANNPEITSPGADFDSFREALGAVMDDLCRLLAADGEGATKLLECAVSGAKTKDIARKVAKSVVCSSLLKAAMFGADANWGRVLCAIGYSGADVDVSHVSVEFKSPVGAIEVCRDGAGVAFSEDEAKKILSESEILIAVGLHDGNECALARGCDLTYDYVKINGDYRT